MVFHLPDENNLRTKINYTQQFTYTLLWNVGLFGILCTSLFLIFILIKQYQLKSLKNQRKLHQSMISQDQRNSTSNLTSQNDSHRDSTQPLIQIKENPQTKFFKIINILASIFFYLIWITVGLIYLTFYMFGQFGRGTHIDVLSIILMALIVVLPTLLWKHKTKVSKFSNNKRQVVFTIVMLSLWLCVSIFLVIATKGACVCYFNDKYGFKIQADVSISSQFTRNIQIDPPCPENQICHVYATVPQDTSSSFFLNIHAGTNYQTLFLRLKLNQTIIAQRNSSTFYKMNNVEQMGQRNLHVALFKNLTQNTIYKVQIFDSSRNLLKQTSYKTVPGATAEELRMAVGGDLGMTKEGQQMTYNLIQYKPDIIILGGDTVYDDGMRSCYDSWDNFYNMFEPIYDQLGYMVPLVMSIGNHDVGFDALTQNEITYSLQQLPLFLVYNPQHSAVGTDIPQILDRQSIHYHLVGPTIHLHLDSGYVKSYVDQVDFIRLNAMKNMKKYKFANYHNPIYPSCTNSKQGSNDRLVIDAGKKYWTPLFDEFNFIAVMQHHTHHRKFTYKIKNDKVNDLQGTRYVGDGSWGVTENSCPDNNITPNPQLIENYQISHPNHMWQITLKLIDPKSQKYSINYTAINLNRTIVTQKIQQLNSLL